MRNAYFILASASFGILHNLHLLKMLKEFVRLELMIGYEGHGLCAAREWFYNHVKGSQTSL